MSFTDGKQFEVDQERRDAHTRHRKRFGCSLCGHDFKVGDSARWIYANGTTGAGTGNFFVCASCDVGLNSDIIERAKASLAEATRLAKQWGIYGPDWEQEGIRRFP